MVILFMAESITMAHILRPLMLAEILNKADNKIFFACSKKYQPWVEEKKLSYCEIYSLQTQTFQQRLSVGKTFLVHDEISDQVTEDLQLLQSLCPDVVIGDFRLSLGISARIANIPYLSIINSYWPRFDPKMMPVPDIPFFRFLGRKPSCFLFFWIRHWIVPLILKNQVHDFNKVRREFGLPLLNNVIDSYYDADYLLFADAEELIPPPKNFHTPWSYLGPLAGSLPCELPEWWPDLSPELPLVYINLGSSGRQELVPEIVEELKKLPIQIIVGSPQLIPHIPGKVFSAAFLPGEKVCARADLIICNGGAPSVYQALLAGKPVIGITNNLDQRIGMPYFSRVPFVKQFRGWDFNVHKLMDLVKETLNNKSLNLQAQEFSIILQKYDIQKRLLDAISKVRTRSN